MTYDEIRDWVEERRAAAMEAMNVYGQEEPEKSTVRRKHVAWQYAGIQLDESEGADPKATIEEWKKITLERHDLGMSVGNRALRTEMVAVADAILAKLS